MDSILLFELYHTRMDFNMVEAGGIELNITFSVVHEEYPHMWICCVRFCVRFRITIGFVKNYQL